MDKNYLDKVKREIHNIKKCATEEELNRLDFNNFNPSYTEKCIYGKMTGHCNNRRAVELIRLCCNTKTSFDNLSDAVPINKKPRSSESTVYFSYLEHYIYNYRSNNKHIIDFLKGEVDKLTITLNK